jgi:hypothetical protein
MIESMKLGVRMDVTKSVPEILLKIVLKCVENSDKILFLNLKFEFKYIYKICLLKDGVLKPYT